MIGAGSAALRRVVDASLRRQLPLPSGLALHEDALAGDSVNSIIEREIIPRLMLSHRQDCSEEKSCKVGIIGALEADRFASLPLRYDAADLLEEVDRFLADGVSVDAIYLDLLAPAARRLGELWEADECDFIDVTMGLWRLQEVMREVSARVPINRATATPGAKRALLASMPGDQHSMGPLMLEDVFARDGWSAQVLPDPQRKELLDLLSWESFDLVGLTLARDCPSAALANIIKAMRSVSCNPNLSVLVGGRMINQNPAIVAEVGADGTGADARAALQVANALVRSAEVRAQTSS
jgi:methanogenic corrinoid protein MtbC1